MKTKGYTDKEKLEIDDDMFDIGDYITGLSKFIQQCPTPMTISIQGDWGSGKTSFMNMIREELRKSVHKVKVHTVWLNTWQFSQFDLGDSLSIILLTKLIASLTEDEKVKEEFNRILTILAKSSGKILSNAISGLAGIDVEDMVKVIKDQYTTKNLADTLSDLKNNFQKTINTTLKQKKMDKLLIFVDDLDRLPPSRAIELLEVLKVFLDCDKCVFVLAIDYDVVAKGVVDKYGDSLEEKKGKSFFDKIIQLPFKIPVAQYNIDNFIKATLKEMEIEESHSEAYRALISSSVGYNPRSMKRLFNSYTLLRLINQEKKEQISSSDTGLYEKALFGVLAMQTSYEPIYNYIARNISEIKETDFFDMLSDWDALSNYYLEETDEKIPSWFNDLDILRDENERARISNFMEVFVDCIAENGEKFQDSDFELLMKVFNLSSVTSIVGNLEIKSGTGKATRYKHEHEKEFSYYGLDVDIENTNGKNGWKNADIDKVKILGVEEEVKNFVRALKAVLEQLYTKDPVKFMDVREKAMADDENKTFRNLFKGGLKDGFAASCKIDNANILVETKTDNNTKVKVIRTMMEEMGYKASDVEFSLKLAKRQEK